MTRIAGHSRRAVYKNSEYLLSRPSHFTVSELKKAHKGDLLDSHALSISSEFCISKHILVTELAVHFSVFVALLYSVSPVEKKGLSVDFSLSTQTYPHLGIIIHCLYLSDTNWYSLPMNTAYTSWQKYFHTRQIQIAQGIDIL